MKVVVAAFNQEKALVITNLRMELFEALLHYPMVCWVSTLNRKAEVKSTTLSTQTTCSVELLTSKSPEISAYNYFDGGFNLVTMQEPNEIPDHSE